MPPDREHGTGERDDERGLERELRDLGASLDYPPTPDLARATRRRLEEEGERPSRRGGFLASLPSPWWAAAAAVVLVLALPMLSPQVRSAVSGFFTMGGAAMSGGGGSAGGGAESGDREGTTMGAGRQAAGGATTAMPSSGGGETESLAGSGGGGAGDMAASGGGGGAAATAHPGQSRAEAGLSGRRPSGESLGLGENITLREARARSEAPILFPRSPKLGEPNEVYDSLGYPGFILLYRPRPGLPDMRLPGVGDTGIGLLLTQSPGDVGRAYLAGGTAHGQGLETASVDGGKGYWVPPGERRLEVARGLGPSSGVLLWERDGQALRLEADVSKGEAIRIAESVR